MPAPILIAHNARLAHTIPGEVILQAWTPYPHQIPPPGNWDTWLLKAGRGAGKTEAAARFVRDHLVEMGPRARVGVGSPIAADARDVCAEGETGLITLFRNEFRYNRSLNEAFHINGGYVKFMGCEKPDRWRGPQWSLLWFDELAACNAEAWDLAQFGLRLGTHPRAIATTTPKKRAHMKALEADPGTVITRATTYDNPALPEKRLAFFEQKYKGTRLGLQELLGQDIDDVEGAYWQREWIENGRVLDVPRMTTENGDLGDMELVRVVTAIDPAGTHKPKSDETGIAVAGLGEDGEFYVMVINGYRLPPAGWARRALAYHNEWMGDRILAEVNQGGEMVEHTIRTEDPDAPVTVIHASRGKAVRAEPVAALYEQGRVHHVGIFPDAEDQMCAFPVENEHDDLVDALVYAITDLAESGKANIRWIE